MSTKLLYLSDSYCTHAQAKITGLGSDERGSYVQLDQTIFYPQGGGQPSDTGQFLLGSQAFEVESVRWSPDRKIMHYLLEDPGTALSIGQKVELKVDPDKRLLHTKVHTAGHLLDCVIEEMAPGTKGVKAHHWPGEAYVEFDPEFSGDQAFIDRAEARMQELISQDLKVEFQIDSEGHRMVQIEGYHQIPCGGTQVSSLGQLERVRITKIKSKKDRTKVSYSL